MKILYFGNTPIFEDLPEIEADYCAAFARELGAVSHSVEYNKASWFKVVLLILRKRYDIIFLPSINIGAARLMSRGLKKRFLDIVCFSQRSVTVRKILALLGGQLFKGVKIGYLDRNYHTTLFEGLAHFFGAGVVFKTHLADVLKAPPDFQLRYLPMWIQIPEATQGTTQFWDRPIDLFFAGALTSTERQKIAPLRELAMESGLNIYWPHERISHEEFKKALRNSKVCLSPEGAGWHCFRHYEALASGAVPLINYKKGVMTDLQNGKNCLIYDSPTTALELLTQYCRGHMKLDSPEKLASFARKNHSFSGVGKWLVSNFHKEPFEERCSIQRLEK